MRLTNNPAINPVIGSYTPDLKQEYLSNTPLNRQKSILKPNYGKSSSKSKQSANVTFKE